MDKYMLANTMHSINSSLILALGHNSITQILKNVVGAEMPLAATIYIRCDKQSQLCWGRGRLASSILPPDLGVQIPEKLAYKKKLLHSIHTAKLVLQPRSLP